MDPWVLRELTNELPSTVTIAAGKSWSTTENQKIGKQQMWHHFLKRGKALFYHVPSSKLNANTLKNKIDYQGCPTSVPPGQALQCAQYMAQFAQQGETP